MTAALEGGEWSAARPGCTLSPRKTRSPFYRRLVGPQGRSGQAENLVFTGIRSLTFQPVVSGYTDWATRPTEQIIMIGKTTRFCRSGLFWDIILHIFHSSWIYGLSTIGLIGCPEMSVRNHHSLLRNIPEERRIHLHRAEVWNQRRVLYSVLPYRRRADRRRRRTGCTGLRACWLPSWASLLSILTWNQRCRWRASLRHRVFSPRLAALKTAAD